MRSGHSWREDLDYVQAEMKSRNLGQENDKNEDVIRVRSRNGYFGTVISTEKNSNYKVWWDNGKITIIPMREVKNIQPSHPMYTPKT